MNEDKQHHRPPTLPPTADPDQVNRWFTEQNVHTLWVQFVDIHGAAKGKLVPVSSWPMLVSPGAGFAGNSVWGLGIAPNGSDFFVRADPSTLQPLSWAPGVARVCGRGYVEESPWPLCSRNVLLAALQRLEERGWVLNLGFEPEFSLLDRETNSEGQPQAWDTRDQLAKPSYDSRALARRRQWLIDTVAHLQASGLAVYQIDHEDAPGQYEINVHYQRALESCDALILLKSALFELAESADMRCSFMPKPWADRPGNGLHLHLSFCDLQTGKNLFASAAADSDGARLAPLGRAFMAGLLRHAQALTALSASTVNSYKRLVVGRSLSGATWAPAFVQWGVSNRSCLIRVPGDRLEWRLPDGLCNPYLLTAALIHAGLDGIDAQLSPGPLQSSNLYEWSLEQIAAAGIPTLPQNLGLALDAFIADDLLVNALGPVAKEFIELKRQEWTEYSRHVSDWEIKHYLDRA